MLHRVAFRCETNAVAFRCVRQGFFAFCCESHILSVRPRIHDVTDFATRLRKARLNAGLSQRELARSAEIDVSQISRYEKGAGEPRPGALKRIAETLDSSAEWLVTGNPDFDPELTTHVIKLDLDPEVQEKVRAIAERDGRTVEDVIRIVMLEALAVFDDGPQKDEAKDIPERQTDPGGPPQGTNPSTQRRK